MVMLSTFVSSGTSKPSTGETSVAAQVVVTADRLATYDAFITVEALVAGAHSCHAGASLACCRSVARGASADKASVARVVTCELRAGRATACGSVIFVMVMVMLVVVVLLRSHSTGASNGSCSPFLLTACKSRARSCAPSSHATTCTTVTLAMNSGLRAMEHAGVCGGHGAAVGNRAGNVFV